MKMRNPKTGEVVEVADDAPQLPTPEAPSTLHQIADFISKHNPGEDPARMVTERVKYASAGAPEAKPGEVPYWMVPPEEAAKVRAFTSGLTFNAAPHVMEAAGAFKPGEAHDVYKQAVEENPGAYAGGAFASPNPASKVGGVTGILARLGYGGASTALASKLARPEETPKETAEAGLLGAGGAGVGELAGRGALALRGVAQRSLMKIEDAAAQKAAQATNSARGTLGTETAQANRALELIEKAANDPLSPHMLHAQDFLRSPEGRELIDSIAGHYMEKAPQSLNRVSEARQALQDAISTEPARARSLVDEQTASPLTDAVMPRLRRYAGRAAGAAVGGMAGGPAGALVGGAVAGQPGTALGNMVHSPQFQYGAATQGQKALAPIKAGAAPAARTGTTFMDWLESKQKEAQERLP